MRPLIVVTANEGCIKGVWLPSLRDKGAYDGDVLIVDYEYSSDDVMPCHELKSFSKEYVAELKQQKNVYYRKVSHVYNCIPSDRILQFYRVLKGFTDHSPIIITDGNDIEFLQPIQPLIDLMDKDFCYISEIEINRKLRGIFTVIDAFPQQWWEKVWDKPIINAGVFGGPYDKVMSMLKFMVDNMEKYDSNFGSEQYSLNVAIYNGMFEGKQISCTWDYTMVDFRRGAFKFRDYTCYGRENPKSPEMEIAIIHQNSFVSSIGKYDGKTRKRYDDNGNFVTPYREVTREGNWLFRTIFKDGKNDNNRRVPIDNWLFHKTDRPIINNKVSYQKKEERAT